MKGILLLSLFCLSNIVYGQSGTSIELKEITDLLYVDQSLVENDSLQRLNLVLPQQETKMPLLLWIGGGAWSYVNRHMEMGLARQFASEGIAVASVGHRLSSAVWRDPALSSGVQHPAHIEDIAVAFKWLYDHAETYGYDQDQIFIGGYSSGAHLVALLSMAEKYLSNVGLVRENIKGVIPIAGAYDVSNYHRAFLDSRRPELADQHVKAVFGNTEDDFADASPTSYMDSIVVPMLLISEPQSYNYTRIFEESLIEAGFSDLTIVHQREMGHGDFWSHLAHAEESRYRDLIVDFIRAKVPSTNTFSFSGEWQSDPVRFVRGEIDETYRFYFEENSQWMDVVYHSTGSEGDERTIRQSLTVSVDEETGKLVLTGAEPQLISGPDIVGAYRADVLYCDQTNEATDTPSMSLGK